MSFRTALPATVWFVSRFTSRLARRVYVCALVAVLLPAIVLRLETVFFQFRVLRITSVLAALRIGVSSKTEALSRIPSLKAVQSASKDYRCVADECYAAVIPNSRLSNWILLPTFSEEHWLVNSALRWWGFQYWDLEASVYFTAGKVSSLEYRLLLSPRPSEYPDAIVVTVVSRSKFEEWQSSWDVDDSPDYVVFHGRKFGDLQTGVYITRNTPTELLAHAFDLHLACLWSLVGCRDANQVLPQAEADRLAIRRAAIERLKGPDQCPDRILTRRVRDAYDILLVNVRDIGPTIHDSTYGEYRMANIRLLRLLKGRVDKPVERLRVAPEFYFGELTFPNSAYSLLRAGQDLVLFPSDSFDGEAFNINHPCDAMAATPEAVQKLESALSSIQATP